MKNVSRAMLAAAVLVCCPRSALAGPKIIISGLVSNAASGISCTIVNAGKKPLTVARIETVGILLGTHELKRDVVLDPDAFIGVIAAETLGYCRFTIDRSPKTVRAAACRFESSTGPGTNFDCVEAR